MTMGILPPPIDQTPTILPSARLGMERAVFDGTLNQFLWLPYPARVFLDSNPRCGITSSTTSLA